MAKNDYYETLGVLKSADKKTIKRAYRDKARKYHPDVNKSEDAHDRFKEINEAYEVLSDEKKRQAYDQFGHAAFDQAAGYGGGASRAYGDQNVHFDFGGFSDPFEIFEQFFGSRDPFGFGGRRDSKAEQKHGQDLAYRLSIDFAESIKGVEKKVRLSSQVVCDVCNGSGAEKGSSRKTCQTCGGQGRVRQAQQTIFGQFMTERSCPQCHGEGEVINKPCEKCRGNGRVADQKELSMKIPAGIEDGAQIRYSGEGDAGMRGSGSGDLYIQVHVKPHANLTRRGGDIFVQMPLTFGQAALGDNISVPVIDPEAHNGVAEAKLKIPAGTSHGTEFRLRGKGMPRVRSSSRGDVYVTVKVETPKRLNANQKKLFEQLSELDKNDSRGWFEKWFGV